MNTIFSLKRDVSSALALSALALFALSTQGQEIKTRGQVFPDLQLPKAAWGTALIDALGNNLTAIAAWYGKTGAELRNLIAQDPSLHGDIRGKLLYICDAPPPQDAAMTSGSGTVAASPFPGEQTFLLHSRPGATRVIYLDFKGHTTSGTSWNSSFTGGASFVTPPYDIDGNTASFSTTELERIQYIWQRVVEDFAPFNVDVTTEDPGVEALRKTSASDLNYGVRVCIGGSSYDWYGAGAGGVAYLNSFTWNTDTPCYVFTAQLGTGQEKYTAEAISHEAGHTLGLSHDGKTDGTAYYEGHGNWAPIMGVGYYRETVQWSKGQYPLANNTQDDLVIIASYVGYVNDDHGNLISSATPLSGANFSSSGVIENTGDIDIFSFNTGAGAVSLTLACAPGSPNLDALLSLYDGFGNLITSVNGAGMGASINTTLAAGTYYIGVDGVGLGDLATGYSDYASLGQYTLSGSAVSTGNQPPTAVAAGSPTSGSGPLSVTFSSAGSIDPDGSVAIYDWDFGDGTGSSAANPTHVYTTDGNFTATLVVVDNGGLSSSAASVAITVVPPPNVLPVATASATPNSGIAPLIVSFSSAGSYDSDGTITGYSWNFGNGTTSTLPNPSTTCTSPGTYTATLTVTDNHGGTASKSVNVTVSPDPSKVIFVSTITMSLVKSSTGNSGRAAVNIKDSTGAAKSGATVTGKWTGLTTATVSGTTDNNGNVTFTSKKVRKNGTFTFTVTGVSASTYTYDASRNVKSSGSVANP